MPKEVNLSLGDLKVKSFVTSMEAGENRKVRGGAFTDNCTNFLCDPTGEIACWTLHPWCCANTSPR